MSLSVRSFSLKCLKKTTSLYTRSLRSALSTNIFNYSYSKSKYSSQLTNVAIVNKNFRLYSTSPISWNDVDSIIAGTSPTSEATTLEKKTKAFEITDSDLMKFVTDLGINGCKSARTVIQKETGRSRGFGYLDFVSHEDAVNALAALQGKELDGRALKLDLDEGNDGPRKGRRMPLTSPDFSIYIGNLPFSLRNEELRDTLINIFGNDFGAINVRIAFADYTRSRGFAHVDFANQESANIALEKLAGFEIQGRPAIIRPAAGKLARQDNAPRTPRNFEEKRDIKPYSGTTDFSVFIGNLPWEADKDLIREMIDDVVGKDLLKRVLIHTDKETGRSKGFGHLNFDSKEAAEKAVSAINGLELYGRPLRAELSQPRSR